MATTPPLPGTTCPHCGAANPGGAAFCESCGKALPTLTSSGPRIVSGNQFATTTVGQELQADELHKQAKRAASALLAVAVIQTFVCVLVFGAFRMVPANQRNKQVDPNILLGSVAIIAVVFWGLYFWARKSPLPAAITGLVVYVSLSIYDFIAYFQAVSDTSPTAVRPPVPWMKIVVIAVLAQAISSGVKHRRLLRETGMAPR